MSVIGFSIAVDRCGNASDAIEVAKLSARVEPRLSFLATAVVEAYAEAQTDPDKALGLVQASAITDRLRQFMRDPLSGAEISKDVLRLPIQIAEAVSPVHFDAIAGLAASLADWPVHIGAAGLDGWEAKHALRIRRVFTYQSDPRLLVATADSFHWEFLHRLDVALVTRFVIVSEQTAIARKAVSELVDRLTKKTGDKLQLQRSIRIVEGLSGRDVKEFKNLLIFDPRRLVRISPDAVTDKDDVTDMKNLLIYELEAPKPFSGSVLVGFVDDAAPGKLQTYGVALSSADVSEAQALFKRVSNYE